MRMAILRKAFSGMLCGSWSSPTLQQNNHQRRMSDLMRPHTGSDSVVTVTVTVCVCTVSLWASVGLGFIFRMHNVAG